MTVRGIRPVLLALTGGVVLNVSAASFGTLFTTPEQRARLDNATLPAGPTDTLEDAGGRGAATAMQVIHLDGTMVSSLGRKELWINGVAASRHIPAGLARARVGDDGLVSIRLDHASASRSLKAGQLYLPDSGEIQEAYRTHATQAQE